MGSSSTAALGLMTEYRIWVCGKNHIYGSVYDKIVRVSGHVVKEVVDGLIGTFSGWWLLSNYGIEGH